jgi:hypothetical protein
MKKMASIINYNKKIYYSSGRQPMVREKVLVLRGEILDIICKFLCLLYCFIILLYYFKQAATNITLTILL